ncbi:MAG: tetrahydrofolate dehydrogenase/cyclohydrolase catalytic domain-containing protein [Sporomusaceae bacterium]|nr:tetrahydrofolate dehydrogenase/cyclohydrolase catalytic domain-containing protein [Sporomusaceae bacterium]
MAIILAGGPVAAVRKEAIRSEAAAGDRAPKLAIILAGDDAASRVYSQRLQKLGETVGIDVALTQLPQTVSEPEVLTVIDRLNSDPGVDSILPMMPMPPQISAAAVAARLSHLKDVDSLNPLNAGLVATGKSRWAPCTPRAVMAILDYYRIPLAGRQAVIVGRSNVVGKPLAQLLLAADATVTVCHSKTADLAQVIGRGDIVIAAVGRPQLIQAAMVKPGAVVIDVGINDTPAGLVGDVDFASVEPVAAAITPVPGGVGTVSTVMVMEAVLNQKKRGRLAC